MRGEVHILVYCPIDTFQWGSTHSALLSSTVNQNTASQPRNSHLSQLDQVLNIYCKSSQLDFRPKIFAVEAKY